MELNQKQVCAEKTVNEPISIEECKKYLGNFGLCDKRMVEISNSLIGIVDRALDSYFETFNEN